MTSYKLLSYSFFQQLFYENHYPWKENENYAVHIYHKRYKVKFTLQEILALNNTVGDLARFTMHEYEQWKDKGQGRKYLL